MGRGGEENRPEVAGAETRPRTTMHCRAMPLARSLTLSVLPVPAGPAGAPPRLRCIAPVSVIQQRSVSGVTTSRVGTPSYSKPYAIVPLAWCTTHDPPPPTTAADERVDRPRSGAAAGGAAAGAAAGACASSSWLSPRARFLISSRGSGFSAVASHSKRSCICHVNDVAESTFSLTIVSVMSRACTSAVMSATSVRRSSLSSEPDTSRARSASCERASSSTLRRPPSRDSRSARSKAPATASHHWICAAVRTSCEGWRRHHARRSDGRCGASTSASLSCLCSVAAIASSTRQSHSSTAPRVLTGLMNGTCSPSGEIIAAMSSVTSAAEKSSALMQSKHLIRCGCTACGLRACARISSSSSFERKQKRGKAARLVSRCSSTRFCVFASVSLAEVSHSSTPLAQHALSASGSFSTPFMRLFQP